MTAREEAMHLVRKTVDGAFMWYVTETDSPLTS